jgi:hypothetical protein
MDAVPVGLVLPVAPEECVKTFINLDGRFIKTRKPEKYTRNHKK